MSPRARLLSYLLRAALSIMWAFPALAEAIVSGTETELAVEARDTTVQDVLALLGEKFGLRYHGLSSVGRPIAGTYAGSLRAVVTRLLDGYDYVMKIEGGRIEVFVLRAAGQNEARAAQAQAVPIPTRRRAD
jgi:hypothetical protein